MNGGDEALSEVVDSTLIIALGIALAVVVAVLVFGIFKPVDKSAYLVPQFGVGNLSGHTVITIFNRAGDPVWFNASPEAKYQGVLYLDTPSGSFRAATAPSLIVFRPGETVYAYYTGTGFVLTNTLAGVTFPSLPGGKITARLVDITSGTVISQADLVLATTLPPVTPPVTTPITTRTTTTGSTTTSTTTTGTMTTGTTATTTTTTTSATITTGTTGTTTTTRIPTSNPTPCPPGFYKNGKCPCDAYAKSRGYC